MTTTRAIILLATVLFVVPASAGALEPPASFADQTELPKYDVARECEGDASWPALHDRCIARHQQAYDSLKKIWSGLTSEIRRRCLFSASIIGGTYPMLNGCVERELEAANRPKKAEFKY